MRLFCALPFIACYSLSIGSTDSLRKVAQVTKAWARSDAGAQRLKDAQAEAIREAIADGASVKDIAKAAKMTPARIYQIRDGRR